MNEVEHALTVTMEEASEVVKACSKALRFGLDHLWDKEGMTNREAIVAELKDVNFMVARLQKLGVIGSLDEPQGAKAEKFARSLAFSRSVGRVCDDDPEDVPYR